MLGALLISQLLMLALLTLINYHYFYLWCVRSLSLG